MKLKRTIIGALHLAPLIGHDGHPGRDQLLKMALQDLKAFQDGGVDAVIFENNYDLPHVEHITAENLELMADIGSQLKQVATVPLGVNVLWNDYQSALTLAMRLGLQFIRVPVYVDDVRTSYGRFKQAAEQVERFRKEIGAEAVDVYADIQVKHAEIISDTSIVASAERAFAAGANGVIVTGRWTGEAPDTTELHAVKQVAQDRPVLVGSGADAHNIKQLFKDADAVIVSTSLKEGSIDSAKTNLTAWSQRVDVIKVRQLVEAANQ